MSYLKLKCFSSLFSVVFLYLFLILPAAIAETLPQSDDRRLNQNDLLGFTKQQLRFARNEIFARKGYIFKSKDLRKYFSQFSWYKPISKNVKLNSIESTNVSFIKKYEVDPSLFALLRNQDKTSNQETTIVVIDDNPNNAKVLVEKVYSLDAEIVSLKQIIDVQKSVLSKENEPSHIAFQKAVLTELSNLSEVKESLARQYKNTYKSRYSTSIKPNNANLGNTLIEQSKSFPKVPFYIAGTDKIGEMWLEPKITNVGKLAFNLNFVDPETEYEAVIETIELNLDNLNLLKDGLSKVYKWSIEAKKNNVRQRFEKIAACTNLVHCENRTAGQSSTQIDFLIYEDGSTASKIIQNKGTYSTGFNYSIESTLLLASYFNYLTEKANDEMIAGSRTNEDLDKLFE